jgi:hypothetical protein
MTAAGLDVDPQPGLAPADLLRAVDGARHW